MTQVSAAPTATAPGSTTVAITDVASSAVYQANERTTPTRHRDRASYDRAAVHAVLDEALVCHVGFVRDGAPVVLPTLHARVGETLYVHGSSGGRFAMLDGEPLSITVTLIDGVVLARSWMHHSAAYRSVVVHGRARVVQDADERWNAMATLIDHVAAGRSGETRPPTKKELAQTAIVALDLVEVSLKVRDGAVTDEEDDLTLPTWAGFVPLRLAAAEAVAAPDLSAGIAAPVYTEDYRREAYAG